MHWQRRPRTLMRSSSTPPAVVTSTSTSPCCTRYRICSRVPADIRLDVKPRKIFECSPVSGARHDNCAPHGSGVTVSQRFCCRLPTALICSHAAHAKVAHHAVDFIDALAQRGRLETAADHRGHNGFQIVTIVEVIAPDDGRAIRHFAGCAKHRLQAALPIRTGRRCGCNGQTTVLNAALCCESCCAPVPRTPVRLDLVRQAWRARALLMTSTAE
jgi:hypothetical protein